MVLVQDIPEDLTPAEVLDLMKEKNPSLQEILKDKEKISFRFKHSSRNLRQRNQRYPKRYHAAIECTPRLYRMLVHLGRVNLADERHRVKPFVAFTQCFRCCGFGHTAAKCQEKNPTAAACCPFCSEGHALGSCPKKGKETAKPCCGNCKQENEKFNTKHNIEHMATDWKCPTLMNAKLRFANNVQW